MTLPWYPRDMGLYARDTKHLTMLEHGAYNLLLDYYYSGGQLEASSNGSSNASLLPDHSRIYRVCSAVTREEQTAVDSVLKMFFTLTDGLYRNRKADEVIETQEEKHRKRVEAGRKGGQSNAGSNASSNTPQNQSQNKNLESPLPPRRKAVDNGDKGGSFHSEKFGEDAPAARVVAFNIEHHMQDHDVERARSIASGWDMYFLYRQFNGFVANAKIVPRNPQAMFFDWLQKFTKGKKP